MARSKLLLEAHLKALRLPTFLREYDKLARQCAAESLDSRSFLQQLCELERLDREQRATERRIKAAKFPVTKSLDTFNFPALPALNKKLVLELARCEFIDRRENVLALGNSGTGKTHIGLALGLAACQRGYRTRFTTAAALVNELLEARDERRLLRCQKQLTKQDLLIVDELGYAPLSKTGAELLFEVFSQRYERAIASASCGTSPTRASRSATTRAMFSTTQTTTPSPTFRPAGKTFAPLPSRITATGPRIRTAGRASAKSTTTVC